MPIRTVCVNNVIFDYFVIFEYCICLSIHHNYATLEHIIVLIDTVETGFSLAYMYVLFVSHTATGAKFLLIASSAENLTSGEYALFTPFVTISALNGYLVISGEDDWSSQAEIGTDMLVKQSCTGLLINSTATSEISAHLLSWKTNSVIDLLGIVIFSLLYAIVAVPERKEAITISLHPLYAPCFKVTVTSAVLISKTALYSMLVPETVELSDTIIGRC